MSPSAVRLLLFASLCVPGASIAGPVTGKLELPPPPERGPLVNKGFLERTENPIAPIKPVAVLPYIVVVLEGGARPEVAGVVTWELAGESFARPVFAAATGAEIVIRNVSRTPRTLFAAEDPKLIQGGPINPTGPKSLRVAEPKVYTIQDKVSPFLRGKLVIVPTKHIAYPDAKGHFEFTDVPEGSYKLRVFYKDNWIDRPDDTVTVGAKGKVEVPSVKIPAGFPLKR
ncbi:MAG: hypothetical protein WKG01_21560 [Kofleriaceae bacterium]